MFRFRIRTLKILAAVTALFFWDERSVPGAWTKCIENANDQD
jgi:hypothetical protein